MTKFDKDTRVKCINAEPLKGNVYGPPIELDAIYPLLEVLTDHEGNEHFNVGLVSSLNYIRSYETKEKLPNGDKIHWCHPSRFEFL